MDPDPSDGKRYPTFGLPIDLLPNEREAQRPSKRLECLIDSRRRIPDLAGWRCVHIPRSGAENVTLKPFIHRSHAGGSRPQPGVELVYYLEEGQPARIRLGSLGRTRHLNREIEKSHLAELALAGYRID